MKSRSYPIRLTYAVLALILFTVPARLGWAQQAATLQGLALSTGSLIPAFDPAVTEYTITALGALFPIQVTAVADPTLRLTINGQPAATGVPLSLTLKPREDVAVSVESSAGDKRTYTVRYLPSNLPAYTVTKLNPAQMGNESIFLTPGNIWLLAVNREGDPLYYRAFPNGVFVADFKQHRLAGGKIFYSYALADNTPSFPNGAVALLDDQFRLLGWIPLPANRNHGLLPADLHDFILLGENHYLVMAYYIKTVDLSPLNPAWAAGAPVIASVIQEIDHGRVVFEWDSTDLPSLYTDSVTSNAYTKDGVSDYTHINSFEVDPEDRNLIISLRHTNSILKLHRSTGATIWTLGGRSDQFGLTGEQRFSHQHHARKVDNGRLLMFDNGNNSHPTRIVSFLLDEPNKKVALFEKIYERPREQPDSTFMGSAAWLEGSRYIIGWGGRANTTATWPSVTEIVGGMPVWSLTFTAPNVFSYRALPVGAR